MNAAVVTDLLAASWIWLDQDERKPHQYACFRRSFDLADAVAAAHVDISADSDFVLWINGIEVGRGQFSDYPQQKTFTRYAVESLLRKGTNTVAVLAYYRGEDFSEHRAGEPGLILSLRAGETLIATDDRWRAMEHPAFASGQMPRVTGQMGFTVEYDARREIDWVEADLDDSAWPLARSICVGTSGFWEDISPRPVAPLSIGEAQPVRVVVTGELVRPGEGKTFAETVSNDFLLARSSAAMLGGTAPIEFDPPTEGRSGAFLIADVGKEEVGLLTFSVEAPEGTVLDIAHGEHLADGRVRAKLGGRNFADRYICKAGMNAFTLPFRRLGARYLEMHITSFSEPVKVHYLGLKPQWLEVERVGEFVSGDPMADGMHRVGVRTLDLCMHEHYEDCPWREQSLYAYDSRLQVLYGFYAFGNYDFAATSFDLLGRGLRDDGLLEMCAPARIPITIPTFTHVWITCLAEQWLHSGSRWLFDKHERTIRAILDASLSRLDDATGLYRLPAGKHVWNFYEWTDGLGGGLHGESEETVHHALYNLYLHEAVEAFAWMLRQSGNADDANHMAGAATALGKAIDAAFWDETHARYATWLTPEGLSGAHDAVQVLAVDRGVAPADRMRAALDAVYAEELPPMTLSSIFYLFRALMDVDAQARSYVSHSLARFWEPMMLAGATSFWEAQGGEQEFGFAGSLCHAWSAAPVWFYQAEVLGIKPLAPGFERFRVRIYPDRLFEARGKVPTPSGPISVEWKRTDGGLVAKLEGPAHFRPVLEAYPEARVASATYNGVGIPRKG